MPRMSDPKTIVQERAAALAKEHNLSKARREGAELALQDAYDKGEWDAGETPAQARVLRDADEAKIKRLQVRLAGEKAAAVDPTAIADQITDALRANHVNVSPQIYQAIKGAIYR